MHGRQTFHLSHLNYDLAKTRTIQNNLINIKRTKFQSMMAFLLYEYHHYIQKSIQFYIENKQTII
jgi:hypothetical protein